MRSTGPVAVSRWIRIATVGVGRERTQDRAGSRLACRRYALQRDLQGGAPVPCRCGASTANGCGDGGCGERAAGRDRTRRAGAEAARLGSDGTGRRSIDCRRQAGRCESLQLSASMRSSLDVAGGPVVARVDVGDDMPVHRGRGKPADRSLVGRGSPARESCGSTPSDPGRLRWARRRRVYGGGVDRRKEAYWSRRRRPRDRECVGRSSSARLRSRAGLEV